MKKIKYLLKVIKNINFKQMREKINNIKSEVENINDISYEEVELGKAVFNKFGLDYRQY